MKQLVRNKVFWIITLTDIIQFTGIWIRNIAILFFVMEMTNDSPNAVSAIHVIEMVPMLVFSFVGGIIADRFHPKKTMLLGDTLSMISFGVMGLLITRLDWWIILFATFVSAIVSQFSYPSSAKYLKEYVPHASVDRAIAFNQSLNSLFPIIGPALGTYFYYAFEIQTILFMIVGLYALSIITLLFLPKGNFPVSEGESSIVEDAKDSLRYIRRSPLLNMLTIGMFFIALSIGLSSTLDIFLVTERLGLSQGNYQFFAGIAGVGMIVGTILYMAKAEWFRHSSALIIMYFMLATTIIIEGISTIPALTLALQFVDNVIFGILSAYMMGSFTKGTEQAYTGKVTGFINLTWYAAIVIASATAGPLMAGTHIVVVYALASVFMLMMGFISLRSRESFTIVEVELKENN